MARNRFPSGRCFSNAWRWACNFGSRYASLRIVHGYPRNVVGGDFNGHAWLEWRGWAFDPTTNEKLRPQVYYSRYSIDPQHCRRYTVKEAAALLLETKHFGPWHDWPSS